MNANLSRAISSITADLSRCTTAALLVSTLLLPGCQTTANLDRFLAVQNSPPAMKGMGLDPQDSSNTTALVKVSTLDSNRAMQSGTSVQATASGIPTQVPERHLNLPEILRIAGIENPTIALAEEAVQARVAEQLQAQALLFPTLNAGVNFNLHRGDLQSAQGIIRDVDRQALYAGAGARAIGAGPVTIPGAVLIAHLADAVYAPQAAEQQVSESRFTARATRNTTLLEAARQYLALLEAEARLRAIGEAEAEFAEIIRLTANFAKTGQGREGDAERARAEGLLLQNQELRAREDIAVNSAALARLLSLDPSTMIRSSGPAIPLIELVSADKPLEELIPIALAQRPELSARAAELMFNEIRLHQERVRPFVPVIAVGFSAGEFGGGSNRADTHFGHFAGRTDLDAIAVWSIGNLGVGNAASQRQMRARLNEAAARRIAVVDQIRREVAEAHAIAVARRQEVEVSCRRAVLAQRAYRLDLERAKNLQGRIIEVQNSANLLNAARLDLIRSTIAYNQAQFDLFVSLGHSPTTATIPGKPYP